MMSLDDAIRTLRNDPQYKDLIYDSYLDGDVPKAGDRFLHSAEFQEVQNLIGNDIRGGKILDLGAGTGIASFAFAKSGAQIVYALEPDPSDEVGCGAIDKLRDDLPINLIKAAGEQIPLPDGTLDIVYTRQVLHHIKNLPQALKECARVLKPGGLFLACREHVVDDAQQLGVFLANHPVHRLAGGENAYPLEEYLAAVRLAGLTLTHIFDPWDSVINSFPAIKSNVELRQLPDRTLRRKFGQAGSLIGLLPGIKAVVWKRIKQPYPGRMYSFMAAKPK